MNLIAFAVFIVSPPNGAPAVLHERMLEPSHFEKVASTEIPKSIWRVDGGDGVHLQSTLVCPNAIGRFDRSQLIPFDGFGLDVGCNFDASGLGRITLFLTRRHGQTLNQDFEDAKSALHQSMPGVVPIAGSAPVPAGLNFTSAVYTRTDSTRTGLWVADVSGWTFEFRATYTADQEKEVLNAMSGLTEKMNATAGQHLSACAAAAPAIRNGAEITDKDKIMSLSLMAMVSEAAEDDKGKPAAVAADQWCAETPVVDQEAPVLFWRNILLVGNAGAADRVSLMTIGEPPILVSSGNPTASLIEKEASKADATIYQLTGKKDDTTFVFEFFNGRPASATLTPIAKDVFLGRRAPVTSFNAKTNTITIPSDDGKPGT